MKLLLSIVCFLTLIITDAAQAGPIPAGPATMVPDSHVYVRRACEGWCLRGLELGRPYTRLHIEYSPDYRDEPLIRMYFGHLPQYCSDEWICNQTRAISGYAATYSCATVDFTDETGTRKIHCF